MLVSGSSLTRKPCASSSAYRSSPSRISVPWGSTPSTSNPRRAAASPSAPSTVGPGAPRRVINALVLMSLLLSDGVPLGNRYLYRYDFPRGALTEEEARGGRKR